jgi:hypothetical protein
MQQRMANLEAEHSANIEQPDGFFDGVPDCCSTGSS